MRHVRRVEGSGGAALAIKKDKTSGRPRAMREFANAGVGNELRVVVLGLSAFRASLKTIGRFGRLREEIDSHLGHHNFHDAFAISSAGDAAEFRVGVAAAADQGRIADAARMLAAGAAGRCAGEDRAMRINSNGSHRALRAARVIFGGV